MVFSKRILNKIVINKYIKKVKNVKPLVKNFNKNKFLFFKLRLDRISTFKRFFSFIFFSPRKRNRKFFRLVYMRSLFFVFVRFYRLYLRVYLYSFFFNLYYLKNKVVSNFFYKSFLNKLLSRFYLFKKIVFSRYVIYFLLRYFLIFLLNYIELSNFRDEFYKWNWKDRNFLKAVKSSRKKFNIFFASKKSIFYSENKNFSRFLFAFLSRKKLLTFFKEQDIFHKFLRNNVKKIYRFFFSNKIKNSKYVCSVENKFFYLRNSCILDDYKNNLNFWFLKYNKRV